MYTKLDSLVTSLAGVDLNPNYFVKCDLRTIRQNIVASLEKYSAVEHSYRFCLQEYSINPSSLKFALSHLSHQNIEAIARRSYLHPNGFVKIVLLESQLPFFRLRLHVWPSGQTNVIEEDAHNHGWDVFSTVMAGRISIRNFNVVAGSTHNRFLLNSNLKDNRTYEFLNKGPCSLSESFTATLNAGAYYQSPSHTIHRVHPEDNALAATLVLQGISHEQVSSVFIASGGQPRISQHPRALRCDELKAAVDRFLKSI